MKNIGSFANILLASGVAAAVVVMAGFASTSSAQENGAMKLIQLKPINAAADAAAVALGDIVAM